MSKYDMEGVLIFECIDENKKDFFRGNNLLEHRATYAKQILADIEKKFPNCRKSNSSPPPELENGPENIASLIDKPLFSNCFDNLMTKATYHTPKNISNNDKLLSDIIGESPINIYDTINYKPKLKEITISDKCKSPNTPDKSRPVTPAAASPPSVQSTSSIDNTTSTISSSDKSKLRIKLKSKDISKEKSIIKSTCKKVPDAIIAKAIKSPSKHTFANDVVTDMDIDYEQSEPSSDDDKCLAENKTTLKPTRDVFVIPKISSQKTQHSASPARPIKSLLPDIVLHPKPDPKKKDISRYLIKNTNIYNSGKHSTVPTQSVIKSLYNRTPPTRSYNSPMHNRRTSYNNQQPNIFTKRNPDSMFQSKQPCIGNSYQRPPNSLHKNYFNYKQENSFSSNTQVDIQYPQHKVGQSNTQQMSRTNGQVSGRYISNSNLRLSNSQRLSSSSSQLSKRNATDLRGSMITQNIPNLHGRVNSQNMHSVVDQMKQMNDIIRFQSLSNGQSNGEHHSRQLRQSKPYDQKQFSSYVKDGRRYRY